MTMPTDNQPYVLPKLGAPQPVLNTPAPAATTTDSDVSDADLDAGLAKLGLSADRVKSLRANLKATGMTDADIRKQLLGMSTAAGGK